MPLLLWQQLLFSVVLLMLLALEWSFVIKDAALTLDFDGENWLYQSGENKELLVFSTAPLILFKSEFLLVLGFKTAGSFRRRKIYLAADNCPQESYRAVCRLLKTP